MLTTQGYFSLVKECLQQHGLFCFSHHSTIAKARGAQGTQKEHTWKSWPNGHPISHEIAISQKSGKKKEKEKTELWRLLSLVTVMYGRPLLSWGELNYCMPIGSGEPTPFFPLLVYMTFTFHIKMSLSTCIIPFLSPIALCGEQVRGCVCLSCLPGLAQIKIALCFKWKHMFVYLHKKD